MILMLFHHECKLFFAYHAIFMAALDMNAASYAFYGFGCSIPLQHIYKKR